KRGLLVGLELAEHLALLPVPRLELSPGHRHVELLALTETDMPHVAVHGPALEPLAGRAVRDGDRLRADQPEVLAIRSVAHPQRRAARDVRFVDYGKSLGAGRDLLR